MEPGDELHLARSHDASVGFSVLRAGQLVMAAGPLSGLPLGDVEVALTDRATGAFGIPTGVGSMCRLGFGSRLGVTLTAQLLTQDDAFEMER